MPPLPWFKYYPNDFFNDPNVARMTLEEIGMYHLMLRWAWNEHPPGSLPASLRELSAILGQNFRKTSRLLSGTLGRCWYESEGRLWNPRLVKEAEIQHSVSEGGKRGAAITNAAHPPAKASAYAPANQNQISESDQRSKEEPKISCPPNGGGYTESFVQFWKVYPRKKGKGAAFRRWRIAIKMESAENIIEAVVRHLPEWRQKDPRFIPMPETWLSQKRWEDDVESREEAMKRIIAEVEAEDGK
jgi:uncharacterized protein YdaU (DUF1376 family)